MLSQARLTRGEAPLCCGWLTALLVTVALVARPALLVARPRMLRLGVALAKPSIGKMTGEEISGGARPDLRGVDVVGLGARVRGVPGGRVMGRGARRERLVGVVERGGESGRSLPPLGWVEAMGREVTQLRLLWAGPAETDPLVVPLRPGACSCLIKERASPAIEQVMR